MTPNRTTMRLVTGVLVLLLATPAFAQDLQGFQPVAPPEISPYETGPKPHEGYFFTLDELYWSISRPRPTLIGSPNSRRVVESATQTAVDVVVSNNIVDPQTGNVITISRDPMVLDDSQYQERDFFSAEDTSSLTSKFVGGERMEMGHVEDGHGWMVSFFRLRNQGQGVFLGPTDVNFDVPLPVFPTSALTGFPRSDVTGLPGPQTLPHGYLYGEVVHIPLNSTGVFEGPLPVTFSTLDVRNSTEMWSVEASLLHRLKPLHYGGNVEWFLGARYLQLDDLFFVHGTGGILDESQWDSQVQNHIVGPQIGARLFKQFSRLIFSTEGRFTAGYNRQNFTLHGFLGSNLIGSAPGHPASGDATEREAQLNANISGGGGGVSSGWAGSQFWNHDYADQFSGIAELRFDARYVVTRNIDFRVGFTGMWIGNIGRASNDIIYQVPVMLIDKSNAHENAFVYGINVGVDINR